MIRLMQGERVSTRSAFGSLLAVAGAATFCRTLRRGG